jgi:hypothetical protein
MIHKFVCNGHASAVILGEIDLQVWRLWGYMEDDQPDAVFYHSDIVLQSSHVPSTSISSRGKRAAQQSIQEDGIQHKNSSFADDEGKRIEDEDEQPPRIPYHRRRRSSRSKCSDSVHGHRNHNQKVSQQSRTPVPQHLANPGTRGNDIHIDDETSDTTVKVPQSTSPPLPMKTSRRMGSDNNPSASNTDDQTHSSLRAASKTETSLPAPANKTGTKHDSLDQTHSEQDHVHTHSTHQSAPDFKSEYGDILMHILLQRDIATGSGLQKALELLERAAEKFNEWQFNAMRKVVVNERAKAGLEALPSS